MRYEVNIKGLSSLVDLTERLEQLNGRDISRVMALALLPVLKERIHDKGEAADGGSIGNYDTTKELWVNPTTSPGQKFPAVGKTGRAKFESTGEAHKTGYFPSYAVYKKATGRDTLGGKANLFLSGSLQNNFTVITTDDGWGLGWFNPKQLKQARGLETHFSKKIYALTTSETELAVEYATQAVNDVIRND